MSQHSMSIPNQPGASFRADLNNMSLAIASQNSGATAPSTTYAYMWWADTANDRLKQRNAANSAWISVLVLSTGAPVSGVVAGAITSSGLTQATARLLGRTTASTGAVEEITPSSAFSFTGGALDLASAGVTPAKLSQPFTSGSAVATTSGTAVDFTGVPSWAKRVVVILAGVSTSGTSPVRLQIGGGSVETSGYESSSTVMGVANGTSTAGFDRYQTAAADVTNGVYVLTHIGSDQWVCEAQYGFSTASNPGWINGRKTTAAALDRVRLTTAGGTDTFDAGKVNIFWE